MDIYLISPQYVKLMLNMRARRGSSIKLTEREAIRQLSFTIPSSATRIPFSFPPPRGDLRFRFPDNLNYNLTITPCLVMIIHFNQNNRLPDHTDPNLDSKLGMCAFKNHERKGVRHCTAICHVNNSQRPVRPSVLEPIAATVVTFCN